LHDFKKISAKIIKYYNIKPCVLGQLYNEYIAANSFATKITSYSYKNHKGLKQKTTCLPHFEKYEVNTT
jgi:hypothetical protein